MQRTHWTRRTRGPAAMAFVAVIACGSAHALILDIGDGAGASIEATRPAGPKDASAGWWSPHADALEGGTNQASNDWLTFALAADAVPLAATVRVDSTTDVFATTPNPDWPGAAPPQGLVPCAVVQRHGVHQGAVAIEDIGVE